MKDLEAFVEELGKNKSLADKFKDVGDPAEVVRMAKKEGYEFTEDEYMDKQMEAVSGGINVYPCVEGAERPGWRPSLLCPLNLISPSEEK